MKQLTEMEFERTKANCETLRVLKKVDQKARKSLICLGNWNDWRSEIDYLVFVARIFVNKTQLKKSVRHDNYL